MTAKRHIRSMMRKDHDQIIDIESKAFDVPWTAAELRSAVRQPGCIGLVVEDGDEVLGYVVYTLHLCSIHVQNFAVAFDARRDGVGRAMAEWLWERLIRRGRDKIWMQVQESNRDALEFWTAMGFRATGVCPGLYDAGDTSDDAILMEKVKTDS